MIKCLSLVLLVVTPAMYADWMDDLSGFVDVKERKLDYLRAEAAVQKLVDEDKQAMKKHQEDTQATDDTWWGTVSGYLNVAKWGMSKKDCWYHQQVLDYITEIPNNPKEHDGLVDDLIHLLHRKQELELLFDEYDEAKTWKEKVTLRGYIVAKKAQIQTRKALIDKRVFI